MATSMEDFGLLTPDPMMQGLVQVIVTASVVMKYIKFIQTSTLAYRYNRQSALPGIAFRNVNAVYGTQSTGVINPEVENLSIFGGPVMTDTVLLNGTSRQNQIAQKIRNAGIFFDYQFFNGNPQTTPGAFYGLASRLTGAQVLSAGTNGGPIVLDQVVALQDQTVGTDNSKKPLFMNKTMRRALSSQARAEAHGQSLFDATGTQIKTFNDSPIVTIDETDLPLPPLSDTETWGTNTTTASIYCIRFGDVIDEEFVQGILQSQPQGLQSPVGTLPGASPDTAAMMGGAPFRYRDVGDFGEYYKDLIEGVMGLGVFHPRAASRLAGLTYTASQAD